MAGTKTIKVLFLADTHLGLDCPARPRIERRRRGPEFYATFEKALAPALAGEVDLVVHGGDVFFRSKIRHDLVQRGINVIQTVTGRGVPFYIVPGNHERSRLPGTLLWHFDNCFVFDHPRTFTHEAGPITIALSGFPYSREDLTTTFPTLLAETEWREASADIRLLCLHHIVEGSQVGPSDYTFRRGKDVLPGHLVPHGFAAVLTGHVHRRQVLENDLAGHSLACPVFYPGSTERTSFAEKDETKGTLLLEAAPTEDGAGKIVTWSYQDLPSRPMVRFEIDVDDLDRAAVEAALRERLDQIDPQSIVRIRIVGTPTHGGMAALGAAALRDLAPPTMNVSLRLPAEENARSKKRRRGRER